MDGCMKLYFFTLLLFLFFFPNAASGLGKRETGSQSANEVLSEVPEVPNDQYSMLEQYEAGHWFAKPSNNMLTVIGVSNHLIRRQDEIAAAKEDAARKAAMYFGIQGKIETVNSTGANFFDYQNDSNVEIIYDTDFEKYKNQLAFDPQNDVLVTREGTFVRFQYAVAATGVNYNSTIINGRPNWLRNHGKPEFEGYLTAVGFSRNQRRLKDTIIKSAQDAVVRMIEGLSTTVNTKEVSVTGQGSASFIHAVSEGSLYGFQVIEFWIAPETGYVYSLAIARAAGQ
jgi:hypothetical protein